MGQRRVWVTSAVLAVVSAGAYVYAAWSPGAPTYGAGRDLRELELAYRLRNGEEHDAAREREGGNPYIRAFEAGNGALLYFGASHTRDPEHPELLDIEQRWGAFEPTVALCEGRSRGYFLGGVFERIAGLPEPALVHRLARRDGVPMFSLEPAYEDEVAALLATWQPDQVALYFWFRVYSSEAAGEADEALALDLLEKRTDVRGLRGSLRTIADIDSIWQRDFADQPDWRTLTYEPDGTYIEGISRDSRRVRGEHMARSLIDLVQRGERVFAVVGSGHVIRQEWALRAAFEMEPAWDQPALEAPVTDR